MAADAVLLMAHYLIILGIIIMGVKGALVDAYLTLYAAGRVSIYQELRRQVRLHHRTLLKLLPSYSNSFLGQVIFDHIDTIGSVVEDAGS